MRTRRWAERAVIGIAFSLVLWAGCSWVVATKGASQVGNVVSFAGTPLLLVPPLRQLFTNKRFAKVNEIPADAELEELQPDVDETQRREFIAFSKVDFYVILAGVALTAVGFILTIILSPSAATAG